MGSRHTDIVYGQQSQNTAANTQYTGEKAAFPEQCAQKVGHNIADRGKERIFKIGMGGGRGVKAHKSQDQTRQSR